VYLSYGVADSRSPIGVFEQVPPPPSLDIYVVHLALLAHWKMSFSLSDISKMDPLLQKEPFPKDLALTELFAVGTAVAIHESL